MDYNITITSKQPAKHIIQIALLKIAYLFAFEKLGHSLIIAGDYANIREQILNPDKKLLPCYGVMKTDAIPLSPGIYHIRQPIDLKRLLVVFDLIHNGKTDRNAVLLPPPYVNDKQYYWEVFKYEGKDITFQGYRKFKDVDFLINPIPEYLHSAIFEHLKPYEVEIDAIGFNYDWCYIHANRIKVSLFLNDIPSLVSLRKWVWGSFCHFCHYQNVKE